MLQSSALGEFYLDLKNPEFKTGFAVYHRRFSTNTNPKWPLAQPMRVLGHNGAPELNAHALKIRPCAQNATPVCIHVRRSQAQLQSFCAADIVEASMAERWHADVIGADWVPWRVWLPSTVNVTYLLALPAKCLVLFIIIACMTRALVSTTDTQKHLFRQTVCMGLQGKSTPYRVI